ncbi:hypothetical protein GTP81_25500 [Rugamonas sp. FT107W]|uniref:Uncharacterized protein n=1 Tax=Duganella vulcania TaxID=2692166 RepID=A0A845HL81_9BURK|nr:hypothetical protein [Duganella vulcania]MYN20102.1 hypothetical protein [Duganella vulcania]
MLNKILGVLESARRDFGSPEQALITDALGGLDLIGKQLASRAADFVANGGDPAVLAELARSHGAAGIPLGRPGRLGHAQRLAGAFAAHHGRQGTRRPPAHDG